MAALNLNNQKAKHEQKVYNNNTLLPFGPTPTYLGVKLDRSLTFHHHLVTLCKRTIFTHQTAEATLWWGASFETLCTASLFLVYSTAEYCTPVWCCSIHTCIIDSVLNDAWHMVAGCLHPTPINHLFLFSDIQPAELC